MIKFREYREVEFCSRCAMQLVDKVCRECGSTSVPDKYVVRAAVLLEEKTTEGRFSTKTVHKWKAETYQFAQGTRFCMGKFTDKRKTEQFERRWQRDWLDMIDRRYA